MWLLMRYSPQNIVDMISCAESKLAQAGQVSYRREYYGLYGLTDCIWHIHQLKLFIFLFKRYNTLPGAMNASTEEDLGHMYDRILRMPYSCNVPKPPVNVVTPNLPPIVDAGTDQDLNSLVTSTTLAGTVTDPDGDSFTVLWEKLSGGNVTINAPNSVITSLTNMQQGAYVFRLTATDSKGNSASDTVNVTIATAIDTIYFGRSDAAIPGTGLEAFILAGTTTQANGANDVYIPWYTGADHPQFNWVAIPNRSLNHIKNYWYVDVVNQGAMSGPTDLFPGPTTVVVNSIQYLFWATNYKTQFTKMCILKHV